MTRPSLPQSEAATGKSRARCLFICLTLFFSLTACKERAQTATEEGAAESKPAPAEQALVLYCGRTQSLIDPILSRFTAETGIQVKVRAGSSATLAALLVEEGAKSRADLFWSQDGGALAQVEAAGLFAELPKTLSAGLSGSFQNLSAHWVPTSGRARVLAYRSDRVPSPPQSLLDLSAPAYRGRVGWAPSNASFQAALTALRASKGEAAAEAWLRAMIANETKVYRKNSPIITALAAGEIDLGLPNHYYLLQAQAQGRAKQVRQRFFAEGDIGNLINVAGIGRLKASAKGEAADRLIAFMVAAEAQRFFAEETHEYSVIGAVASPRGLPTGGSLKTLRAPIEIGKLQDLEGSLALLRKVGLL